MSLLRLMEALGRKAQRARRVVRIVDPSMSILFFSILLISLVRVSSVLLSEGDAAMSTIDEEGHTVPPATEGEDDEDIESARPQDIGEPDDEEEEEAVLDLMEEAIDAEGDGVPSVSSRLSEMKIRKRTRQAPSLDQQQANTNSTPLPKRKKKKARKSETVNLHAVSQEQVLVANMEGTQIVHLRLRKRYYAEALDFIRWLDNASESVGELLGSTHRAEVLESMEFFRVGFEYGIESAAVS